MGLRGTAHVWGRESYSVSHKIKKKQSPHMMLFIFVFTFTCTGIITHKVSICCTQVTPKSDKCVANLHYKYYHIRLAKCNSSTFCSMSAFLAMQTAVIARVVSPFVCLSVRHVPLFCADE